MTPEEQAVIDAAIEWAEQWRNLVSNSYKTACFDLLKAVNGLNRAREEEKHDG